MQHRHARDTAARVSLCAVLLAMMLVLGWLESLLPGVGVPGIKLGLSNGVLIFAVYMLDIPTAYLLMGLKVLLSGLLFGGPAAMLYAFAGGLLSLTCMALLSRVKGLHTAVISMIGGIAHNAGQIAMALLVLNTRQLLYYLGILIPVGAACGVLTGIAAHSVMQHLKAARVQLPQTKKKSGLLVIAAAVIVLAAGAFAVSQTLQPPSGVTVIVERP